MKRLKAPRPITPLLQVPKFTLLRSYNRALEVSGDRTLGSLNGAAGCILVSTASDCFEDCCCGCLCAASLCDTLEPSRQQQHGWPPSARATGAVCGHDSSDAGLGARTLHGHHDSAARRKAWRRVAAALPAAAGAAGTV